VLHQPHGERELIGNDGSSLQIRPQIWRGGAEVIEHVDRTFPVALRVLLPEPAIRAEPAAVRRWPREPLAAWLVMLAAVLVWPVLGLLVFWLLVVRFTVPFGIWLALVVVFGWVKVLEEIGEGVQAARAARGLTGLGRLGDLLAPLRTGVRRLRRRPDPG
jgi:hypothetical protein